MSPATRLEPISELRAKQIESWMEEAQADESKALVLDDEGRLTGISDVDDPEPRHVLGDLDVHA